MLDINDLKKGIIFIWRNDPYEVLKANHLKMGRGGAVVRVKIKNLRNQNVLSKTFHPSDRFEDAEITKDKAILLFAHRDRYMFVDPANREIRFSLTGEQVGEKSKFMKERMEVDVMKLEGRIINISLPIKVDLGVREAPPSIRGDTAQGGKKIVVLENGAEILAPLFIETGDTIRVNTETGEYTERVEKAR
jgi:elongation factor P